MSFPGKHTQIHPHDIQKQSFSTISPTNFPGRRVVVTGLGLLTPFSTDLSSTWSQLRSNGTTIRPITDEAILKTEIPVKVSASIQNFVPEQWIPRSASMVSSRFISFAMTAASLALKDSGWDPSSASEAERERAGVAIGSGIGCVEETSSAGQTLIQRGSRKLSAYTLPKMLANLAAGQVSIQHGLQGPNHCVATACATGAHAVGDAFRFIRYGDADRMLAGGTESGVSPLSMALFSRIHALSRESDPSCASRPFALARDGFVMGEGSGVLFLEELETAKARGAKIYAEIVGYGLSSDAHHVTSPPEGGKGALLCMRNAIRSAGITPDDIGYINCHATSTPLGDNAELSAIRQLFLGKAPYAPSDASIDILAEWLQSEKSERKRQCDSSQTTIRNSDLDQGEQKWSQLGREGPLLSSTKGAIGHALGAAGSIEAAFAVMSLQSGEVPPTIGVSLADTIEWEKNQSNSTGKEIDPRFHDLRIVTEDCDPSMRRLTKKYVMTNSFGFGGSNASLIFKQYEENQS